jgi:lactate dehydrogenase-like 2-hydroxyacid dehydrogenase
LIAALRTGQIRGAALDVFEVNPMSTRRYSTSLASSSLPTRPAPAKPPAMGIVALDNAAAGLAGKPPLTPVVDSSVMSIHIVKTAVHLNEKSGGPVRIDAAAGRAGRVR